MLGGCDSLQKQDEKYRGVGLHWLATSRSCCQSLKHAMCQLEVTSLIHCQIRQICQIWGKSHIAHAHWQYQSLQRDATTQFFGAQGHRDHRWTWSLPWGQFRQARILKMIFWPFFTIFHPKAAGFLVWLDSEMNWWQLVESTPPLMSPRVSECHLAIPGPHGNSAPEGMAFFIRAMGRMTIAHDQHL